MAYVLAEYGDHPPGGKRSDPPRSVDPEVRGRLRRSGWPERSVQADLEEGVNQQRDERGGNPDNATGRWR